MWRSPLASLGTVNVLGEDLLESGISTILVSVSFDFLCHLIWEDPMYIRRSVLFLRKCYYLRYLCSGAGFGIRSGRVRVLSLTLRCLNRGAVQYLRIMVILRSHAS